MRKRRVNSKLPTRQPLQISELNARRRFGVGGLLRTVFDEVCTNFLFQLKMPTVAEWLHASVENQVARSAHRPVKQTAGCHRGSRHGA